MTVLLFFEEVCTLQTPSRPPQGGGEWVRFFQSDQQQKRTAKGAPAIKQVAHGRCLGRRHGRLILPCRFSVFTCFVCAFAFFAQLAIVTILLLTRTRISECRRFYAFAVFVTHLPGCLYRRCLPCKLLFCSCRISGVPETVVPFPPGRRGR